MPTLRKGAIEQIYNNFNRGFFTRHAFEAKFNNENGTILEVVYKDDPGFSFAIFSPGSEVNKGTIWRVRESPGRYFTTSENYDHPQFMGALGSLAAWVDRIAEEILMNAKSENDSDKLQELRDKIDDAAANLHDPDKPFTPEELADWSERFDKILAKMSELEKENEIQKGRVEQIRQQLDTLKQQGTSVPKRTWVKTAANKVVDLFSTVSTTALKTLTEGAVKALLEHKP